MYYSYEMVKKKRQCGRPAGSKNRFHGIVAAADDLGVTVNHLWKVLSGRRESEPLLERVRAGFPALLEAQPQIATVKRKSKI